MRTNTQQRARAVDIAAAFVQHELTKRMRLNPNYTPADIWAGVTHDGRIFVGTPVLQQGQGYYVDHRGHWRQA